MATASPTQRAFVRGRQILDNVFDVECAMAFALLPVDSGLGVFSFDVEASFPSASQAWIWRVLEAMRLPLPLQHVVKALYNQVDVNLLVSGAICWTLCETPAALSKGIRPLIRFWALLCDLVIHALSTVLPSRDIVLVFFCPRPSGGCTTGTGGGSHSLAFCFGGARWATLRSNCVLRHALLRRG